MSCTTRQSIISIAVVTAFSALLCGCGGSKPEKEADDAAQHDGSGGDEIEMMEPDKLGELFSKADMLFSEGATNDAVASLEQGLADPELADQRQQVFSMLVRLLIIADRMDDARGRMLEACRTAPDLAQGALGLIYSRYIEAGDQKAAAEWTETVLGIPDLSPSIRRHMREWNFTSYIQLGEADKVVEAAAGLVRDAPAGDAVVILQHGVDMLFDRKDYSIVERILGEAGKTVTSDAATRNLVTSSRLRLLATQGNWEGIAKELPSAAASLPDADLQRALRRVLGAAAAARPQSPSVDDLCMIIINGFTNKVQAASVAARQWTENAAKTAPAELPDRIELLLNRQFPSSLVSGIFLRYFYDVIDDNAVVLEMKDIGNRLIPLAQDDDTRNSIRTMVLDSCFLVEDYDGALKILRAGVAGYDKAWHDMAISKVEAHKALKENRPVDAIKSFRAFMATVEAGKDNEAADPATGVVHTKPMILGRNAKRIGDIYRDQVKDAEAAKAAYAEARKYYQDALEGKPEPEALKVIQTEMAEIPQ